MSARRVFLLAALTCAGAWLVKLAAIAASGGTVTDGGVVGVLWALGVLAFLVSFAAGTAAALAGRPTWQRAVAAVVAVPLGFVALNTIDAVVKAMYPGDGWLRDEVGLIVAALLLVAVAVTATRRGARTSDHEGLPA
jgi:hypothetical protein